jgi:hypothetical protein
MNSSARRAQASLVTLARARHNAACLPRFLAATVSLPAMSSNIERWLSRSVATSRDSGRSLTSAAPLHVGMRRRSVDGLYQLQSAASAQPPRWRPCCPPAPHQRTCSAKCIYKTGIIVIRQFYMLRIVYARGFNHRHRTSLAGADKRPLPSFRPIFSGRCGCSSRPWIHGSTKHRVMPSALRKPHLG